MGRVFVAGVGMTAFVKPRNKIPYEEMGLEAGTKALLDAGITYDEVQFAAAGYCYGDSTSGQRVLYQLGMTSIPIVNVNNNCSTGSTALYLARQMVESGSVDCAMAIGWEKMEPGRLGKDVKWPTHTPPLGKALEMMSEVCGSTSAPINCQLFANAAEDYRKKYGGSSDDYAKIAEINHRHSANNPYSQFRDVYTLDQIKASPHYHCGVTKLQCCPTSDGAGAVIVVSEKFLQTHKYLENQIIEIAAQAMATDSVELYSRSPLQIAGYDMTKRAAEQVYKKSGISPKQVQVVELHDCFSANEFISVDALGLCDPGKASELVRNGDITYGGKYVVNPSGGLISKGHPLGATGLAQCSELVWQLRGWTDKRRVPNVRYALQHNVGLGGAVVVTLYKRPDDSIAPQSLSELPKVDGRSRLGYNPADECRSVTMNDIRRVQARASTDYIIKDTAVFKAQQSHM
ncbi:hypothetical protein CANCADRAFT_84925 [Tortispora caseinolytica NRRL Y-17796]|uniref:propanoyl-CoA C-acyltransferase n=1 Tax=Tortispora caseinolytica NRRL Y-17796 TaxID=767744 RepID=A0A1E4TKR0_9ASCO|nr:hypothetical protein CANCADRAFT_84925 [Tortispora caseinolytica NRRL Y-17796]